MTTTLTSTVPGAITVLASHLQTVANANPALTASVAVGVPIEYITPNYLIIGDPETGELLSGYRQDWTGMPARAERKSEEYGILCHLRAWSGSAGPGAALDRITEAWTLMDGVMAELQADPGGSGALTFSGTWQVGEIQMPVCAPFPEPAGGFGTLLSFTVEVRNVRITS